MLSNAFPSPSLGTPAVLLPFSQGTGYGVDNNLKAPQCLFLLTTAPSVLLGDHCLPLARGQRKLLSISASTPPGHVTKKLLRDTKAVLASPWRRLYLLASPIRAERLETKT